MYALFVPFVTSVSEQGRIERKDKGVYNFHFYTLTVGLYHLKLMYGPNQLFKNANITTEIVKADQLVDGAFKMLLKINLIAIEPESLNFELRGISLNGILVGEIAPVDLFITSAFWHYFNAFLLI